MNLPDYLEATNQTQGQFSRLIGLPQPMISKWVRVNTPSLRHAITVAARSGGAIGLAELLHPDEFAALREALGDKMPATLPLFGSPAPVPVATLTTPSES